MHSHLDQSNQVVLVCTMLVLADQFKDTSSVLPEEIMLLVVQSRVAELAAHQLGLCTRGLEKFVLHTVSRSELCLSSTVVHFFFVCEEDIDSLETRFHSTTDALLKMLSKGRFRFDKDHLEIIAF